MHLDIARRALTDHRRGLAYWVAGVASYVAFIVAFYPTVREDAAKFNDLVSSYPKAMMEIFLGGQTLDFSSSSSFVNTYLFASMVPIMVLVLAITHGSAAVAGEEEAGTLDLVLAQPVRRRTFVAQKALAVTAEVALVGISIAVVLLVGGPLVELHLSIVNLGLATLGLVLMALDIGLVALAVGAASGRRARAGGIAAAVAAAAYLVNAMSARAAWLRAMRLASPFYWATADDPVGNGLSIGRIGVLVAMGLVALAVGLVAFERRDLGT